MTPYRRCHGCGAHTRDLYAHGACLAPSLTPAPPAAAAAPAVLASIPVQRRTDAEVVVLLAGAAPHDLEELAVVDHR